MKKIFTIPILLLIFLSGKAQVNPLFDINKEKSSLLIEANYQFNSDVITNDFFNHYIFSKFISDDLKNEVIKNLHPYNSFYGSSNDRISYFLPLKNKNFTFFVSLEEHLLIQSSFTDNFFKLLMNGNQQFAGQNISMNNMDLSYLQYEQLKFGLLKTLQRERCTHLIGGAISINRGSNFLFANIMNSSLYTQNNGEYLDLAVNSHISRSDSLNNKFLALNGMGCSLDIYYSFQNKKGSGFRIEFSNLGFIRWNKNSFDTYQNKTYNFEGFYIDNIFNIKNTNFVQQKIDSMRNDLIYSTKKSVQTYTPVNVAISYTKIFIPDKFKILTGFSGVFYSNNNSFVYIKPIFTVKRKFIVSPIVSYNSYAKLNLGMELALTFAKNYFITIKTYQLNGYLFPDSSTGQSFFFSLTKTFN